MRKIRINNDFTHHWAIELDGAPVDLTALPTRLYLIHPRETKEVKQFETNGNIISIELTKALLNIVGVYSLELHYELPDPTRDNGIRSCAVDIRLCQIVATTEQADEISEFTTTSDMAFGFQGKSAYDIAKEGGYEGTYEEYQNSSKLIGIIARKTESEIFSEVEYREVELKNNIAAL